MPTRQAASSSLSSSWMARAFTATRLCLPGTTNERRAGRRVSSGGRHVITSLTDFFELPLGSVEVVAGVDVVGPAQAPAFQAPDAGAGEQVAGPRVAAQCLHLLEKAALDQYRVPRTTAVDSAR